MSSCFIYIVGVSGHVVIDDFGSREPSFIARLYNSENMLVAVADILLYKPDGQVNAKYNGTLTK